MAKTSIKSSTTGFNILGTFEGEALDCSITNKNGLDITADVISNVLDSEEYAEGIEYGWFIGFLGHPEDPGCQEFQNGCIVMTDMSLDDNGKVHASFNLIDTPVGQIVKKFIDAGVTFGISIRGAGDIVGSSVDPDTFMFRGFDLVAFPAYPESIPTFTAIAASTDANARAKYKAVCAAVTKNLDKIESSTAIDVIQSQFAPQSNEYKALEQRKSQLNTPAHENFNAEKVTAMTTLYIQECEKVKKLTNEVSRLKAENRKILSSNDKKLKSMRRIASSQLSQALTDIDDLNNELEAVEGELDRVTASRDALRDRNSKISSQTNSELKRVQSELKRVVASRYTAESQNKKLTAELKEVKNTNLIYKQRIEASEKAHSESESIIADLKNQLRKTVTASTETKNRSSNLDEKNKQIESELIECQELLATYQCAYAEIYAKALGINSSNIHISGSESVEELEAIIEGATNTSGIPAAPAIPFVDDFYATDDYSDEYLGDIVSL